MPLSTRFRSERSVVLFTASIVRNPLKREQQYAEEAEHRVHQAHGDAAAEEQHEEKAENAEAVIDGQPAGGQHVAEDMAAIEWRQGQEIERGQKQVEQHPDKKDQREGI